MSLKKFIQKNNLKILWEVIIDEELFHFLSQSDQQKIYQIFLNNIQGFYEAEKTYGNSLVELNKKYILFILNYIKKTFGDQSPSKIQIKEEIKQHQPSNINMNIKELVTYEDIQNDRKTKFEKDLNRVKEEFQDSITLKTPEPLDFKDKQNNDDGPIKEMDKLLKEIQIQRNYEVENINRTYNNTTQVDNWLKPQETSLKNDKKQKDNDNESEILSKDNNKGRRFRFLDSTLEQQEQPKTVTWNNEDTIIGFNDKNSNDNNDYSSDDDIVFSRLKRLPDNVNTRILQLEKDIKTINDKLDKIFDILLPLPLLEKVEQKI
jgi:hypothetical protein